MSGLEAIALTKDTQHSNKGRVFFTGDISALAQERGYLQVDASGKPRSEGWGWMYNSSSDGTGKQVIEGNLGFDIIRLRETVVVNGLVEQGVEPCVTHFYTWPEIIEVRKIDPTATDITQTVSPGIIYERISASRGALALNVACFLVNPSGNIIRAPPGVMSYPNSWIEKHGSPEQKYLGVWYSYVSGYHSLGSSSKYNTAFVVIGDMLTLEQDTPRSPSVAYSQDNYRFAINLALRAYEVQDWVVSSFGETFHRLINDNIFKEAVALRRRQTAVQFSNVGQWYEGITDALLAKDSLPQQVPKSLEEVMKVYTRTHYKPLVEQLVEKVHADADMTRMMQLL